MQKVSQITGSSESVKQQLIIKITIMKRGSDGARGISYLLSNKRDKFKRRTVNEIVRAVCVIV